MGGKEWEGRGGREGVEIYRVEKKGGAGVCFVVGWDVASGWVAGAAVGF